MASRSQWRVAAIMTSLSWHHHHDVIHFAFTKMADSQNYQQKHTWLLPSICTFFGLIFQKPLTCIRNDIVLHVYFNLKFYENWRKAAYHASSDSVQRVVSYALCVCDVWLPNFALVILPSKLITGDIKFLSKIKYFFRPTDPTFWAVCNRNQTIILSRPKLPGGALRNTIPFAGFK